MPETDPVTGKEHYYINLGNKQGLVYYWRNAKCRMTVIAVPLKEKTVRLESHECLGHEMDFDDLVEIAKSIEE